MAARFILRFDDLCPTAHWAAWNRVEPTLLEVGARPIVAVVPDNRDPKLVAGDADPGFWDRVRRWQAAGWSIGLHGYQHVVLTDDAGIVGLHRRSEFAGLPEDQQRERLETAVAVFAREGVRPDVWVAPFHSFDAATLRALRAVGINTVSDGLALYPFRDRDGMAWVPQQLWRFRPVPLGVLTVCFHVNSGTVADASALAEAVRARRSALTDVAAERARYATRRRRPLEPLAWRALLAGARLAGGVTRRSPGSAAPRT